MRKRPACLSRFFAVSVGLVAAQAAVGAQIDVRGTPAPGGEHARAEIAGDAAERLRPGEAPDLGCAFDHAHPRACARQEQRGVQAGDAGPGDDRLGRPQYMNPKPRFACVSSYLRRRFRSW